MINQVINQMQLRQKKYCFTSEIKNCTASISPTENSAKPNPRVRY
jgi:hypothetical protein